MARSRRYLVLLLLLLAAPEAAADVKIPLACRVRNRPPGRCGWCALETLARHHRLETMYGFTESHPCTCSPQSLEESLSCAGVHYRIQYPGSRSREILHYAVRECLGAAVGLDEADDQAEGHIVTLVGLSAEGVRIIDPNDADGVTRHMSLHHFLSCWDGFALVLEPESQEMPAIPEAPSYRRTRSSLAARSAQLDRVDLGSR